MNEEMIFDIDSREAAKILGIRHNTLIEGHLNRGFLDFTRVGRTRMLSSAQVKMYAQARKNKETRLDWVRVRNDAKSTSIVKISSIELIKAQQERIKELESQLQVSENARLNSDKIIEQLSQKSRHE